VLLGYLQDESKTLGTEAANPLYYSALHLVHDLLHVITAVQPVASAAQQPTMAHVNAGLCCDQNGVTVLAQVSDCKTALPHP